MYSNIISRSWNGVNVLNSSLFETGSYLTNKFSSLKLNDFFNFSALYFLNVGMNNMLIIKKITESKLLNFTENYSKNYLIPTKEFLPTSTFFENEETFVNTTGGFCRTTKLISRKEKKSSWQILRRLLYLVDSKLNLLSSSSQNNKEQKTLINFNTLNHFKDFINFFFFATVKITYLSFFLTKKTKSFALMTKKFKQSIKKIYLTKLTYWLDNFFVGGKDEYSHRSKILNLCSTHLKLENTTFF